jgi:hypothetical protein
LKHTLMTAPLLRLSDFSKRFIVDCDASGIGFGAVLHQGEGSWHFSAGLWHLTMPSYQLMSEN